MEKYDGAIRDKIGSGDYNKRIFTLVCEIKKPTKKWAILTVRMKGLEPPRLAAPDPKSGAAAITPHPQI